ncbi:hypothetical protein [Staphylothermus hellenicus]|uniref:Uncharacterized protein n=1 Tax=Staphylothermus hellenicus (strain DSM 12710 / JCM 10830 / BK20S6-10-b1 / P8) TaxID=591019 RepID=D7D978_STAHD|nr:hypothetical protein [Staphylothermus hellenicus]ADI32324.1 hypothetical protein Shell_1225 [Staphylothermus hellenicus DSM 12710]
MPVRYVCKHCGYVLWEFKEVGQDYYGIPTPEEVIRVYGGICPKCKHDLSIPSINDISIKIMRRYSLISSLERKLMNKKSSSLLNMNVKTGNFMAAQEI